MTTEARQAATHAAGTRGAQRSMPRGEFFHTNWTGTGGRVASNTYMV